MIKKLLGIDFLLVASYFTIAILYKVFTYQHWSPLITNFFSGYFGTAFSIIIVGINLAYVLGIGLLFKYGIKWTKSF
ncbi:hypothetical protein [Gelidibacter salicanalis]|uniref:Uncharacterized protein n=1 Tax=Gelidibacter salicanalis TaxID=291193 RepID=A0A934KJH4_9FLAO|nr:hypothetical protein [Gelidibacter salicanalis]MBJ7880192.1 hypothetical protein [Gelidibacter salicanalis]